MTLPPWIACADRLPPEGEPVFTAIDDAQGTRNANVRLVRKGRLWFFPDMTTHVYYEPTHWRPEDGTP